MSPELPDTYDEDPLFWARMQSILERSVAGLDEHDKAERIAYCRRTGQHGVTAFPEDGQIRMEWGGSTLVVVDRKVFESDAYFADLELTFHPLPPDDASELSEG